MKQDSSSATRARLAPSLTALLGLWLGLVACSDGGDAADGAAAGAGGTVSGPGAGASAGVGGAQAGTGAAGTTSVAGTGGLGAGGISGNAGAGGSTGSSPLSKYAACIAYARALENRLYRECTGEQPLGPDQHATREADCPDLLFADGSNRSVDDVLRCAEQWRTAPCEELLDQRFPDCEPHGQRALGASCMFNVQCSTGRCGGLADAADCKHCVEEAAVGAACTDPAVQCPIDAPCDGQVCADYGYTPPTRAECGEGRPCPDGAHCGVVEVGVYECMTLPGVGEPCEGICALELFCSSETDLCEARPSLGQPCPEGLCTPEAYCRDGLIFDPAPMEQPAICMARSARGATCIPGPTEDEEGNGFCALDLVCACDDADEACTSAHCVQELHEGEACDAPFSHCTAGTACAAGVCSGVESQGLFDACPP